MSRSTDAILAYGWDLGEEIELDWLDQDNHDIGGQIEDRLLDKIAHFTDEWSPGEAKEYWTRKHEAEKSLGVEMLYHGADEYPMYFLAASGSEIRAHRGTPVVITMSDLTFGSSWYRNLMTAKDALGLQITDDPAWYLFSWWG